MQRDPLTAFEVIKAVSNATGASPSELEHTLYEFVDLDAIEQLARHDSTSWTVRFELPEHDVAVRGDGAILVDGTRENTWKREREVLDR